MCVLSILKLRIINNGCDTMQALYKMEMFIYWKTSPPENWIKKVFNFLKSKFNFLIYRSSNWGKQRSFMKNLFNSPLNPRADLVIIHVLTPLSHTCKNIIWKKISSHLFCYDGDHHQHYYVSLGTRVVCICYVLYEKLYITKPNTNKTSCFFFLFFFLLWIGKYLKLIFNTKKVVIYWQK